MNLLASYTYLRTEHFYELMRAEGETRKRAVRRILTLMRRRGYITMEPLFEYREHDRRGYPHTEFVYYLTKKGAGHVRPEIECGQRSPASIRHDLAVSEFHLSLARGIAGMPSARLHWLTGQLKKTVNPDALFGIEDVQRPTAETTFWFFLEMERSRQGHWRPGEDSGLLQKLKRYAHYRGSPEQKREWPFIGDFRVVVAVENDRRAANLADKLRRMLPLRMIWITSLSEVVSGMPHAEFRCPADEPGTVRSITSLLL